MKYTLSKQGYLNWVCATNGKNEIFREIVALLSDFGKFSGNFAKLCRQKTLKNWPLFKDSFVLLEQSQHPFFNRWFCVL